MSSVEPRLPRGADWFSRPLCPVRPVPSVPKVSVVDTDARLELFTFMSFGHGKSPTLSNGLSAGSYRYIRPKRPLSLRLIPIPACLVSLSSNRSANRTPAQHL